MSWSVYQWPVYQHGKLTLTLPWLVEGSLSQRDVLVVFGSSRGKPRCCGVTIEHGERCEASGRELVSIAELDAFAEEQELPNLIGAGAPPDALVAYCLLHDPRRRDQRRRANGSARKEREQAQLEVWHAKREAQSATEQVVAAAEAVALAGSGVAELDAVELVRAVKRMWRKREEYAAARAALAEVES